MQAETVTEGAREEPASRGGAYKRKVLERQVHATCGGARIQHDVEPEIFHGGVEVFFHHAVQAVDFVDKEHVVFLQAREESGQVARFFEYGAARDVDVHAHLFCDNPGECRLAESGRAREKAMVKRIAAVACRLDRNGEALLEVFLAGEFGKGRRSEFTVGIAFVEGTFLRGDDSLVVHSFSLQVL